MRLNKAQSIVITLMNVLIVALVAVILFLPGIATKADSAPTVGDTVDVPDDDLPTDEPPTHNKYRDASQGQVDGIVRETRLMGNGDETVVRVFFRDGVSFIFGNATVKGLDFDEYGGFLCIVNAAGTILSYTYFGGEITTACIMPEGYGVAAGDGLFFVDYVGAKQRLATLDGTALWLSPESYGIAAVTQPSSTSLKYTEFARNGDEYTQAHSTRIESGFTLDFFDCYDFGATKTIVARTYRLPLYDSIGFFSFEPGGSANAYYYGDSAELNVRPYAVMPYANGYFSLVSRNGIAAVLSIDYGFNSFKVSSLGFSFTEASLIFVGGKYYASFGRSDGAVTYVLDDNLSRARISSLDGVMPQSAAKITPTEVLFGGQVNELAGGGKTGIALNFVSTSTSSVSFDITSGTVHAMEHTEAGTIAVISASGGGALSAPTNGKDVYVLLLNDNS